MCHWGTLLEGLCLGQGESWPFRGCHDAVSEALQLWLVFLFQIALMDY